MAEILAFPKKARGKTIRGAARKALTDAIASVGSVDGVLIFAVSVDGKYALRTAYTGDRTEYDVYTRAAQLIRVTQDRFLDPDE